MQWLLSCWNLRNAHIVVLVTVLSLPWPWERRSALTGRAHSWPYSSWRGTGNQGLLGHLGAIRGIRGKGGKAYNNPSGHSWDIQPQGTPPPDLQGRTTSRSGSTPLWQRGRRKEPIRGTSPPCGASILLGEDLTWAGGLRPHSQPPEWIQPWLGPGVERLYIRIY